MHAINNLPESTLDQTTYSHLISAENDMSNSSDLLFHVHEEKDKDFVVFKDDLALGSEKTRAASTPGSLQAAVPGAALLLGSQSLCGERPLVAAPASGAGLKEICPRGNNKVVIIYIFMFMINVYISCYNCINRNISTCVICRQTKSP